MRIAVCDDEEAQRKLIINYLQEWAKGRDRIIDALPFSSAENFWFCWEDDKSFDLLILDIEMGGLSGMDLAKRIREEDEEIPILFITGYETYMAQGYEVSAIQYLLKPMYKEKLFTALDKLQRGKKPEEKLTFQTEDGVLLLAPYDIWFVEAAKHQCILHTVEVSYQVRHSFTELMKILGRRREFAHCHRSYLVNMQHISAITRTEIVMDDQAHLPVSRSAHKAVNAAFIRNYGLNDQKD